MSAVSPQLTANGSSPLYHLSVCLSLSSSIYYLSIIYHLLIIYLSSINLPTYNLSVIYLLIFLWSIIYLPINHLLIIWYSYICISLALEYQFTIHHHLAINYIDKILALVIWSRQEWNTVFLWFENVHCFYNSESVHIAWCCEHSDHMSWILTHRRDLTQWTGNIKHLASHKWKPMEQWTCSNKGSI